MDKPSIYKKLELLVWLWKNSPEPEHREIVQAAYLLARHEGIAFMSWHLHIPVRELKKIGNLKQFRKKANKWRRCRGENPRQGWLEQEYALIADQVVGWDGEERRGRRNTLSKTINRRAAR